MSKTIWRDEYWLMLLEVYLKKPVGMKPLYSRVMVELSLELHFTPHYLQSRMKQIAQLSTPRIERIWNTYSKSPARLARMVALLRSMKGFGFADEFYDGVQVEETFERDFRPLAEDNRFTPVILILILDLYFQLTPSTMVDKTPEVAELAKLMGLKASSVVEVLNMFQICDPYLERNEITFSPLLLPCQQVWRRMSELEPPQLNKFADELKDYFRS